MITNYQISKTKLKRKRNRLSILSFVAKNNKIQQDESVGNESDGRNDLELNFNAYIVTPQTN